MGQYGTVYKRRFSDGVERWAWRKRVPRIPDEILSSIIALYPSEHAAKVQTPGAGASGFITCVEDNGERFFYAVTNRHVVRPKKGQTPAPVIRIGATAQVLNAAPADWHFDVKAPDLAAFPLEEENPLIQPIYPGHFLTNNSVLEDLKIGIGDDVFMVGRFHAAEEAGTKEPTIRFGNIAAWPSRHVDHPLSGLPEDSFLVEMRSQSGFSGSPVFAIIDYGSTRPKTREDIGKLRSGYKGVMGTGFSLYAPLHERRIAFLGVDWGHLPDRGGTSLMTLVVPEREVTNLLNTEALMEQRKELKEKRKGKTNPVAVLDYQTEPEFTKHDFEKALKKVSKKLNHPDK